MDRYTLTHEGQAMFRRMESRVYADASFRTEDYNILHFLYESGPASIDDIVGYTGLSRNVIVNKIMGIINRGYIKALVVH